MRIKASHLVALGLSVGLAGWLVSGELGLGREVEPQADGPAAATRTPEPVAVRVRDVAAQLVERVIVVNGRTEPARAVELRAETEGRVVAIGPKRGAPVAADEVLLTLDPRERAAVVREAEAMLEQRRIEYEAATKLGQKGFQAETKIAEARSALEAARARLERARLNLEHTRIRAPFAGVLEHRPVEIGDFIAIGDAVASVIEQDPFIVEGEVAETEVGHITVGMPGEARLVTGRKVQGRVRYVGSQADPATRTFAVELEVANPNGRFTAGVTAEIRIPYERVPAHRLPASLLALSDEGVLGVKAVDDAGVVQFYPAEIVRADGDALWVAGLPERLRLITVGQGFVRDGERVRAVLEQAGTQGGPLVAEQRG